MTIFQVTLTFYISQDFNILSHYYWQTPEHDDDMFALGSWTSRVSLKKGERKPKVSDHDVWQEDTVNCQLNF